MSALQGWQVSVGSVQLMAGLLLFLIALRPVLEMYTPRTPLPARSSPAGAPAADVSALAFSPLAFPMIVPRFGIGVLVVLAMLRPDHMPEIIGVTSFILLLDLLAMLGADFILKVPLIGSVLGIVGAVMGVLQIALGIDVMVEALRDLGLAGGAAR